MSRLNEEEVGALLDHQLHIWVLVTLTKMWEQGKLMPVKSMKPGRDGTLSIHTVGRSLTSEPDALFSKLSPNILVSSWCLEKAQSLVSSNIRSLSRFSRRVKKNNVLEGMVF